MALHVDGKEGSPVAEGGEFHAMIGDSKGDVEMARENGSGSNLTNNKRMTLRDAKVELERQGLSCDYETDRLLVGVLSECRWSVQGKMDVMVFVHQVDEGVLTTERLVADRAALSDLIDDRYVGGCPPFGAARAIQAIVVYYADTIDPAALAMIRHPPTSEWCRTTFLAAQDGAGSSYFIENKTPYWGSAFYPELRYRAGRLTGRPLDGPVPGLPRWVLVSNSLAFLYLLVMLFTSTRDSALNILAVWFAIFLLAAIVQWYRHNNRKKSNNGRHARLLQQERNGGDGNNNNDVEQKSCSNTRTKERHPGRALWQRHY
jgi:cbb3-type cytochrome oxidase subunit 3